MTTIKAEDAVILFEIEADQGTQADPTKVMSPIEDSVELPDPEYAYEENYYVGAGQTPAAKFKGQETLEGGSISYKITSGRELAFLLGSEDYDDTTDTHILTYKEQDYPPSISLGVKYKGHFSRVYSGVVGSSGELTVNNDDELTFDFDFDALDVDTNATVTEPAGDNFENRPTFDFTKVQSNLQLGSMTFARVTDFAIPIERNTSVEYYVEEDEGGKEILYGRPTTELNATIVVTDDQIYQELLDGQTAFESSISFTKPNCDLTITLNDCNIRSAPHNIPDEGSVEVDVEIVAESIEIEVVDTESGSAYLSQ